MAGYLITDNNFKNFEKHMAKSCCDFAGSKLEGLRYNVTLHFPTSCACRPGLPGVWPVLSCVRGLNSFHEGAAGRLARGSVYEKGATKCVSKDSKFTNCEDRSSLATLTSTKKRDVGNVPKHLEERAFQIRYLDLGDFEDVSFMFEDAHDMGKVGSFSSLKQKHGGTDDEKEAFIKRQMSWSTFGATSVLANNIVFPPDRTFHWMNDLVWQEE